LVGCSSNLLGLLYVSWLFTLGMIALLVLLKQIKNVSLKHLCLRANQIFTFLTLKSHNYKILKALQ